MIITTHSHVIMYIRSLSLHDALPISESTAGVANLTTAVPPRVAPEPARTAARSVSAAAVAPVNHSASDLAAVRAGSGATRSEEHTSELQSRQHLVCRLLLAKNKEDTI